MIKSRNEYKEYLKADKEANKIKGILSKFNNPRWRFLRRLRYLEYVNNCLSNKYPPLIVFLIRSYASCRLQAISVKTGISIPINTFGKGLYLPHYGCIVVNHTARFGDNCIVQCGVNVSERVICGDNIYLGAGSKLLIGVNLESGTIVGANAVVTKSFFESNIVIAGIPAKKVSDKGMYSGRIKI